MSKLIRTLRISYFLPGAKLNESRNPSMPFCAKGSWQVGGEEEKERPESKGAEFVEGFKVEGKVSAALIDWCLISASPE